MFGYNPTVQDRSGEISAAGQLQGAQGLAGGISQVGSSISGAIYKLASYKLQADQADSTAAIAAQMGVIDPESVKMIQALPWQQKVTLGSNLIQLVGQKTMADRYAAMAGIAQQKLDQKGTSSGGGTTSF